MRLAVIGIGSGASDDAAAFAVLEWLAAQSPPPAAALVRCERPLPDLLDALGGLDAAVLVDAARGAGAAGTARTVDEREIAQRATAASSHGVGAERVVALARALERAPAQLAWVAIAIDAAAPGEGLSPAVRDAVPQAGRLVLRALQRLAEGSARDA